MTQPERTTRSKLIHKLLPFIAVCATLISFALFKKFIPLEAFKESSTSTLLEERFTVVGQEVGSTLGGQIGRNKVTIVHFWASWCPPCLEELPKLTRFYKDFQNKGVGLFAINLDEENSLQEIARFKAEHAWDFLDVSDPESRLYRLTGFQGLPATLVMNQKGEVVMSQMGDIDWDSPSIRKRFIDWIQK